MVRIMILLNRLTVSVLLALMSGMGASWAHADGGWFGGITVPAAAIDNGVSARAARQTQSGDAMLSTVAFGHAVDLNVDYIDKPDQLGAWSWLPSEAGTHSWLLNGVGRLHLGERWSLMGRVGTYRGDVALDDQYRGLSDSQPHTTFGMGLKFDLTETLDLEGGWDRFRLGVTHSGPDTDFDLLTLGLKYRF